MCSIVTRKKIHLQHSIDSFTYPILTLPTEITCEFFVYCLPDPPTLADKTIAPMLLMRVCRQWRQIALNEPRLWASLRIDSRTGVPCIVQDWLHRARSVPQSLVVQGCGGVWDCLATCIGKKFSVEQVLELLRRARHLIHCELIDVDESGRLSPIHHTPLLQSHLESLVVRGHETCGGVSGYDLHNSHLLHGLHAPALRILDLGWSYFYHVHTSESSLLTFLISQIDPELDDALLELRGKGMKIHVGHADAA
ncbi:hypothetical protein C8R43DRAFT_1115408 [Mycena crocata]|nr:hypothetical protein C8R43DRAFT_1115408 [Mycena crocata]